MACVCGHVTTAKHMSRHRKRCKVIPFAVRCSELEAALTRSCQNDMRESATLQSENSELRGESAKLREEVQQLRAINHDLEARLDEQRRIKVNSRVIHNSSTTNHVIHSVVNIMPFAHTHTPATESVKRILGANAAESIPKYVKLKHFTDDTNRNIKLSNIRGNTVQVLESDGQGNKCWVHRDRKELVEKLTDANLEELLDKHDALRFRAWRNWYLDARLGKTGYDKTPSFRNAVKSVDMLLMSEGGRLATPVGDVTSLLPSVEGDT